ncbi:1-acyl-sn-glycerol-3-phosphate acyltransferase, partial [Mycobacterium tuberculosis]
RRCGGRAWPSAPSCRCGCSAPLRPCCPSWSPGRGFRWARRPAVPAAGCPRRGRSPRAVARRPPARLAAAWP